MKKIVIMFFMLTFVSFLLIGCDNSSNTPTPEHTHSYGDWVLSETEHWKECECGEKTEIGQHSWNSGEVTTPATETTDGVKTYTCTVCGKTKTENISMTGHTYGTWIPEKLPTCTEDGNLGHYKCTCGKYFDIDYNELTEVVVSKLGHELGDWVEAVSAVCGVNGNVGHYHCSVCDKYLDENQNVLESVVVVAPEHNFVAVEEKLPTCTVDGNTSYYLCENCDKKYVYDSTVPHVLAGNSQWENYPIGNFFEGRTYIVGEGINSYFKFSPTAHGQFNSLTKDLGPQLAKGGTYVFSIDVKSGVNLDSVKASRLDIHFHYEIPGASEGTIILSDGVANLGSISSTEWTTITYEFTVPADANGTWSNVLLFYWPGDGVDLNGNALFIDNLVIYAKDDVTKTNLDTLGRGDFEGYIDFVETIDVTVAAGHQFSNLVAEVPATCTENGLKAHYYCYACEKYFNEDKIEVTYDSLVLEASGSSHEKSDLVPAVAVTCETDGNHAYYICSVCNSYLNEDEQVVSYESLIIEKLGHDLEYIEEKAPTTEEDGYISHFNCKNCGSDFVYDSEKAHVIGGNSQWANYPIGNFFVGTTYIVGEGTNSYFKFAPTAFGEFNSLTKDLGPQLAKGGTYVLSLNVKAGSNLDSVKASRLDIQFHYEIPGAPEGTIIISDGIANLGTISNTGWTTITYEFTVPAEANGTWSNFVFFYWPGDGVDLNGNALYIDNLLIYAKDDVTKTNLDTLGRGDFEGYVNAYVALSEEDKVIAKHVHEMGELVAEVPANCTETGLKAHYQCSCGQYFDEEKNETLFASLVIAALPHDLEYVEGKDATTEEDGYVSHFNCKNCGNDFVYDSEKAHVIGGNSQWANYPVGNFFDGTTYIVGEGTNSYFKFDPTAFGEFNSLTKDLGPQLAKGGTYVLSLNVKAGSNLDSVKASRLDIQFHYEIPGAPEGIIIISDGIANLGTISNTGWTTITYEFTVPAEANGTWSNFVFFYWPGDGVDLNGNALYIDNLLIYAKDDVTKTNLDTLGRGDFEGYVNAYVALSEEDKVIAKHVHEMGELVAEVPANCTETGLKAHYQCSCGQYFDEEKNETLFASLVIAALPHDLEYVEGKDATTEEDGYVSHFNCKNCGNDFVYDSEKAHVIGGNSQWANYPVGNFFDGTTYIVGEGTNSYFKFDPTAFGQFNSLTKDTGELLAKGGTYVLTLNVKAGANLDAVKASRLDIQFHYEIPGAPEGTIIISDGIANLGTISNTGWTTITYEFTVPAEANGTWSNVLFFYWPGDGVDLNGNALYIDNLVIYVKDDATKTNLDTKGRGDFEGYVNAYVALSEEDKIISKLA